MAEYWAARSSADVLCSKCQISMSIEQRLDIIKAIRSGPIDPDPKARKMLGLLYRVFHQLVLLHHKSYTPLDRWLFILRRWTGVFLGFVAEEDYAAHIRQVHAQVLRDVEPDVASELIHRIAEYFLLGEMKELDYENEFIRGNDTRVEDAQLRQVR
ncbi:uncharacterized protein BCR38DRAFT_405233 [Pseudomassariella vexata]|uniref:Uncharacterized protein n=1 Tax=Pseudomassariella vexata TaxID=1141098 RepID=A0A1Y2ED89_9PEZI|nr:uncharacterized protein BCR38DRAFT_405233 [Pseudomassariella vexata]ORY69522.1 hypothetical protein BCR38DRAFT_405233 [Pseudomassariella vexata]